MSNKGKHFKDYKYNLPELENNNRTKARVRAICLGRVFPENMAAEKKTI